MRVIVFGATGMVGSGVLRECLLDPGVDEVLVVVRSSTGQKDKKLRELIHQDFLDFTAVETRLRGYDACFYCLGVTSLGMSEEAYERVTAGFTAAAGKTLAKLNPTMTFVFVSGQSADSTEQGKVMWARIKGKAENIVTKLPFKASYIFRPGFIEPLHGIKSRTAAYNRIYAVVRPLMPLVRAWMGPRMTTTENVGRAMLRIAREGTALHILHNADINAVAQGGS